MKITIDTVPWKWSDVSIKWEDYEITEETLVRLLEWAWANEILARDSSRRETEDYLIFQEPKQEAPADTEAPNTTQTPPK